MQAERVFPLGESIGSNIERVVRGLKEHGVPIYSLDRLAGYARSDNPEKLLEEGKALGGVDKVEIDERNSLLVFNTVAASAHTGLVVDYERFAAAWIEHARQFGIDIAPGAPLIKARAAGGEVAPPTKVALDLITWVVRKQINEAGERTIDGMDIFDLFSEESAIPEEKLARLFAIFERRGKLAADVLADLYNERFRADEVTESLGFALPRKLAEQFDTDVGNYFVTGYYRGGRLRHEIEATCARGAKSDWLSQRFGRGEEDPREQTDWNIGAEETNQVARALGISELEVGELAQTLLNGLGEGPQSSCPLHVRTNMHLTLADLDWIEQVSELSREEIVRRLVEGGLYRGNIESVQPTGGNGWNLRPRILEGDAGAGGLKLEELVKQIDPYSTVFHKYLVDWFERELEKVFPEQAEVASFVHHSGPAEEEFRVAEGWRVDLGDSSGAFQRGMLGLGKLLQRLDSLWQEMISGLEYYHWGYLVEQTETDAESIDHGKKKRRERLEEIGEKYGLPAGFAATASQILPTEAQLRLWRHRLGQKASGDTATAIESIDHKLAVYSRLEKKLAGEATALVEKITGGEAEIPDLVRLINLFLRSQIFDQYNIGYNIPGKPSFGISYYRDEKQNMHILISPLISKKGVAEHWLGAILRRVEGIGRG